MKAKKYLKNQARKDKQAILDADNGKTLRDLGVNYSPKPPKRRALRRALIGALSGAAAVVLVVCLAVFYPYQREIQYIEENFESLPSTVSELNGDMHDFTFQIDESAYSVRISRTSDKVSGDVLYYWISFNSYDSLITMEFVAVCNQNYEYNGAESSETSVQQTLPSFDIVYDCKTAPDSQYGIDKISYTAKIEGEQDTIFVTKYEELLVVPEGTFFDVIQQIVQPIK